jgi:hypothetical protein
MVKIETSCIGQAVVGISQQYTINNPSLEAVLDHVLNFYHRKVLSPEKVSKLESLK